ncbi:MAG TPA: hypothetical protein VMG31_16405 [Verrucomicrobiae bacterium]|nr:hypothetical protein [Verrucomicrobiae bacterium]
MTTLIRRTLFWAPRVLAVAYVAFLSVFALDVFGDEHGFWRILGALLVHLIPTFVLTAGLILAWKWEWVGTMLFAAAGVLYIGLVLPRPVPAATKMNWILFIAGPTLLIAALFLAAWLKRNELHPKS